MSNFYNFQISQKPLIVSPKDIKLNMCTVLKTLFCWWATGDLRPVPADQTVAHSADRLYSVRRSGILRRCD